MIKLQAGSLPSLGSNDDALDHAMQRRAKVIPVDFSPAAQEPDNGGLKGKVKSALSALSPTSQEILIDMFGLRDGSIRSIYEVSHRSGIEAEKVQEISNRALRQLFFPRGASAKNN